MEKRKAPLILIIMGTIAMIGIPLVFFTFGWHAADVICTRNTQHVTCLVSESFAAGIHVRKAVAEDVSNITYHTTTTRSSTINSSRPVFTSNLVFETATGEISISSISSNTAAGAKRTLIHDFRKWMSDESSQRFEHHADMVDIFGWLGAVGVAFWAWLLLSWPYYYLKQRKASQ